MAKYTDMDAETLIKIYGAQVSVSRDESGVRWVRAGHTGEQTDGDGTALCQALHSHGVLGDDQPDDGYHVYPVIDAHPAAALIR